MPACSGENFAKMWECEHRSIEEGCDSRHSTLPSTPMSMSPPVRSPIGTLKLNKKLRRTPSSSSNSSETFIIQSDRRMSLASQTSIHVDDTSINIDEPNSFLVRIIGWYPMFLLKIFRVFLLRLTEVVIGKVLFTLPSLWMSLWVWLFWRIVQMPMYAIKSVLTLMQTPISERFRKKRTVLISGGSTIQALHLARNFYSAGVRVIVVEVEGIFSITKFSTAVHKFYTIPRPSGDNANSYIKALCDIVEGENVAFYVPVCATTAAYYDALAKPRLELLGCTCFCPGLKETTVLDDILLLMQKCQTYGINTPHYYKITSKEELSQMYDSGIFRVGHYVMYAAGTQGIRDKLKYNLPAIKNDLKISHEISESQPWVIVQNVAGENFLTCTTVKDSRIIANVICRVDKNNKGLIPVEHPEISNWLNFYFSKLNFGQPFSGHVGFRFAVSDITGHVLPLGCRVGVPLPYICHTKVHPRVLLKPCKHFNRTNSGPLVAPTGSYWMPETLIKTLRHPSMESVGRLINTVLDKREALFVFWDPLPYCAYYHMQVPFRNIIGFVKRRRERQNHVFSRTLAAPVH